MYKLVRTGEYETLRSRIPSWLFDSFNYFRKMGNSACKDLFDRDDRTGDTIFHELAKIGGLIVLNRIQERTPGPFVDLLRIKNHEGELCTHVVANYHNGLRAILLIDVLVLLGADLNGRNFCAGETVLHRSVHNGDAPLAKWLCEQPQINLNARNNNGLTAYQIANERNDGDLKEILRKAEENCEEPQGTSSDESDESDGSDESNEEW
ncbi:vankyrin-b2.1 [Ichnoviriform fugitivi]|uniref:Vankyrin-b2.1 n=1 Tax=Ichnoviriform fugitivi TaxID=265522 RepID=A2Q0D4_9VIRU|nr:vankyrin-b2.1 [Ichnoviriform fugitivi]BAF45649.1 vankyrin-b2.1 [Ichnoviriform fugitivi]